MIRVLLRLYPSAWRERYGDELAGLVDDAGLTPRGALDITSAALRERQRSVAIAFSGGTTMILGPAWRHPTGWALAAAVVLAPTTLVVLGSLLAFQLGVGALVGAMESANAWVNAQPRIVDLVLVMAPLVGALVALVPLFRLEIRRLDGIREITLGVRLKWLNLLIGLLGIAVGAILVWHIVFESVLEAGA